MCEKVASGTKAAPISVWSALDVGMTPCQHTLTLVNDTDGLLHVRTASADYRVLSGYMCSVPAAGQIDIKTEEDARGIISYAVSSADIPLGVSRAPLERSLPKVIEIMLAPNESVELILTHGMYDKLTFHYVENVNLGGN